MSSKQVPEPVRLALTDSLRTGVFSRSARSQIKTYLLDGSGAGEADLYKAAFDLASQEASINLVNLRGVVTEVARLRRERLSNHDYGRAIFSSDASCRDEILAFLQNVRSTLDVCVYSLTDDALAAAVLGARDRGVACRLISEESTTDQPGNDVLRLRAAGIATRFEGTPESQMHHKFAIADKQRLLTGSYNWTMNAASRNYENIITTHYAPLVGAYQQEFDKLWALFSGRRDKVFEPLGHSLPSVIR